MDTKHKLIKVQGLILKDSDYKEYDKLLTLLTKELGKISVYAFGVRRENSKNIGKIKPFTFLTFEIRSIDDRYTLESASLIKSFDELTSDYDDVVYASYFIELADYFGLENECDSVCDLLYFTFKALIDKKVKRELIKHVFELKMLKYQGIYIDAADLKYKSIAYTWDFVLKTEPSKLYSFKLADDTQKLFFDVVDMEMKEKVSKKFKSL